MKNKKMIGGAIIQLSTVFLLVIQAIMSPIIIGMAEYGKVVFLLTPVFLIAAVFEAVSQHVTIRDAKGSFNYVIKFLIFTTVLVVFFEYINNIKLGYQTIMTIICAVTLYLSTWSQACFYSKNHLFYIGKALIISFLTASVFLSISYYFDFTDMYMYYWMFILAQLSAFLYIVYVDRINNIYAIDFGIKKVNLNYKAIIESISWRLNTIIFTVAFIYTVGLFYTDEVVGQTKYIFTILMGLRFICPFNTPMIHAHLQKNSRSYGILLKLLVFYFVCCLFVFYGGSCLDKFFELYLISFLFEYELYFYSFAVILTSNTIGSYFVFNNKIHYLFFSSIISFASCLFLMSSGFSADYSFFISTLLYGLIVFISVLYININVINALRTRG
ncbi:hypothetical protein WOC12_05040 [Vibrio parahaemolyticus]|uniref:hypothetical protein n=1 Tax=Vibrio parahaemolyticus TaxID=670 RepID=UPI00081BCDD8|nr:hypothetical protein [Vibrio parahaemolyticus]ELB2892818.1 hypothetical protein [Vibrio alginolyticus]EGQ9819033.1 hypothetical protein [Vibrio parahaemolyticus]EHZ2724204.1 hypothetical protein [Vibrio parahaemolyticus]EIV1596924.1 hypothetical protein [Vibrio parahaemolyticus]EJL6381888.1 hypothetical protein [Vibrio parahaemolyticus]